MIGLVLTAALVGLPPCQAVDVRGRPAPLHAPQTAALVVDPAAPSGQQAQVERALKALVAAPEQRLVLVVDLSAALAVERLLADQLVAARVSARVEALAEDPRAAGVDVNAVYERLYVVLDEDGALTRCVTSPRARPPSAAAP